MHNGFLKNTLCAYFEGPLAYFPEILNQRVRMETFSIKLNFLWIEDWINQLSVMT